MGLTISEQISDVKVQKDRLRSHSSFVDCSKFMWSLICLQGSFHITISDARNWQFSVYFCQFMVPFNI